MLDTFLEDELSMKYVAPVAELVSIETATVIAASECTKYINPDCPTFIEGEEME